MVREESVIYFVLNTLSPPGVGILFGLWTEGLRSKAPERKLLLVGSLLMMVYMLEVYRTCWR